MGLDRVQPVPDMFAESRLFAAARVAVAVQVKLVQVEEQQVKGARPEEQLVGEVVLVLPGKVPDAAREPKVPLGSVGAAAVITSSGGAPPLVDVSMPSVRFASGSGLGRQRAR